MSTKGSHSSLQDDRSRHVDYLEPQGSYFSVRGKYPLPVRLLWDKTGSASIFAERYGPFYALRWCRRVLLRVRPRRDGCNRTTRETLKLGRGSRVRQLRQGNRHRDTGTLGQFGWTVEGSTRNRAEGKGGVVGYQPRAT